MCGADPSHGPSCGLEVKTRPPRMGNYPSTTESRGDHLFLNSALHPRRVSGGHKSAPLYEICGYLRPADLLLPQGDRLRVEFFDFVGGGGGVCGWGFHLDFHKCFGKGFGVDGSGFIQRLRVGVDGKK